MLSFVVGGVATEALDLRGFSGLRLAEGWAGCDG